jgi:hypothetical protein
MGMQNGGAIPPFCAFTEALFRPLLPLLRKEEEYGRLLMEIWQYSL